MLESNLVQAHIRTAAPAKIAVAAVGLRLRAYAVACLEASYRVADGGDQAREFVAQDCRRQRLGDDVAEIPAVEMVEVGPADSRVFHLDLNFFGARRRDGPVLDADVARAVQERCSHLRGLSHLLRLSNYRAIDRLSCIVLDSGLTPPARHPREQESVFGPAAFSATRAPLEHYYYLLEKQSLDELRSGESPLREGAAVYGRRERQSD